MAKNARSLVKRPLTPEAMGRAGQAKFGELCDLGNLIANDSSRADSMGWDYLVEVPFNTLRGDEDRKSVV